MALQDKDRVFLNLYGQDDWKLAGARRRGIWDNTKDILVKGRDAINDDFYEDLTPETLSKVLDELAAGRQPKVGPQVDRLNSAPVGGMTTLKDLPKGAGE